MGNCWKVGEVGMTNQEAIRILDEQRNKFMDEWVDFGGVNEAYNMAIQALKEHEAKQYNSHEVACIIADLFGDPCACNFNDIDTWLPYKCDFRETCCPNPVGVACWEQYLKHKEGR